MKQIMVHDEQMFDKIDGEVYFLKLFSGNQRIVEFVSATAQPSGKENFGFLYILLELAQESLAKMIQRNIETKTKLSHVQILKIFREMCFSVSILHTNNPPIAHRDLKLEDFLLFDGEVKLCDLGSATFTDIELDYDDIEEIRLQILDYTSLPNKSPEMVNITKENPISTQTDIWNLGCLLYKLFYRVHPFEGKSDVYIMNGFYKIPEKPKVPEKIKDIIKKLLTVKASMRPDIQKLTSIVNKTILDIETEEEEKNTKELRDKIEGKIESTEIKKTASLMTINGLEFTARKRNSLSDDSPKDTVYESGSFTSRNKSKKDLPKLPEPKKLDLKNNSRTVSFNEIQTENSNKSLKNNK